MTNIEKRILLNQREIMYTLKIRTIGAVPTNITNGLNNACKKTNELLKEEENDQCR